MYRKSSSEIVTNALYLLSGGIVSHTFTVPARRGRRARKTGGGRLCEVRGCADAARRLHSRSFGSTRMEISCISFVGDCLISHTTVPDQDTSFFRASGNSKNPIACSRVNRAMHATVGEVA